MTRYIPASPNGLISAVKPPDMRWRLMGGIFYVHVFTFESDTALQVREMYSQAQRLSGGKLGGVILDLRNNQGGLLDMSAEVAGLFLPDGASIGTIMNRRPHANETLTATSNDITNGLRIVVLVDKQTASGAEIVAGALKFNRRAIVVGETTAGSGFVKTEIPLPGSGILSLVTSTIILPSGQDLQSNGIVPDVIFRQQTGPGGAGASAAVTALGDGDPQNDPEVQEAAKLLM
jgi:carboxyl-terminal processing protease